MRCETEWMGEGNSSSMGQEVEPEKENLRRQLAAVVRNIQWSYAIFWALSARQQGILEWNNGYYNGDIKTRKTTQSMEIKADRWGLQRSEQLKELYISLSSGDSNLCTRRPSASLSPEDLTDSEWYYLVCMSFTFSPGQGLPGRTLSGGNHLWLCNAHFADSKIFSRSLLAKSAFIQTVACFPLMGGVLELGTTELALEDLNFVKKLTDSFWDFPRSICSEQSMSDSLNLDENEDQVPPYVQQISNPNRPGKSISPVDAPVISSYISRKDADLMEDGTDEIHQNTSENFRVGSPDYSSDDCLPNQQMGSSFTNGMSLVHSWQFVDDDQSNGLHASLKTSDCISQSFVDPHKKISSQRVEKLTIHPTPNLQEGKWNEPSSDDLDDNYLHYRRSISAILKTASQHVQMPCFLNRSRASSFTAWKQHLTVPNQSNILSQKLLKRVLFGEGGMHEPVIREVGKENKILKKDPALDFESASPRYLLSEQKRKEKLNEKFLVLRSLVPSLNKVDKVSILDDTIDYLKDLEKKIQELESLRDLTGNETKGRKRFPDVSERTSDNYGNSCGKKPCSNKRKMLSISDIETDILSVELKDRNADVSVTVTEDKVTIEVNCPWRECLLLEIVDVVSSIPLDAHSVRSSNESGMISMTIQSKFQGTVPASPAMIKQALYRVICKC